MGDEIDRLGGAAQEDDLAALAGIDKLADPAARTLVRKGRLLAEEVDAAVDIGVFAGVVALERVEDRQRLLGGRAVVEVDQILAADFLAEYWEVAADLGYIKGSGHRATPATAWSSRRSTSWFSESLRTGMRTRSRTSPAKARVSTRTASRWPMPRERK